ncbi:MAG TPA: arabinofuranosidase catalytic domain-containing protein [Lacibacter sp.]|nr:arabinofuranosidase catalytic domain-containing protein [Lacibacter sp.]
MFHAHNQTAPDTLLFDLYPGAESGYAFIRLRTGYTGALCRVRRSNDNAEQDISYITNSIYLDTTAMKAFVGANSAFIVSWYGQSTNLRTLTQMTTTQQPRIMNAGVVERVNGNVAAFFDGSNDYMETALADSVGILNTDFSLFMVQKRSAAGVRGGIYSGPSLGNILTTQWTDNNFYLQWVPSTATNGARYAFAADATATLSLIEGHVVSNVGSAYKNNSAYSLSAATPFSTTTTYINQLGRYGNSAGNTSGHILQLVFYKTNQTGNRSAIATKINNIYNAY